MEPAVLLGDLSTDARLGVVIESLEFSVAGKSWLGGVPHDSPRLFGGKFGETCFPELEGRKQASSLAALFPTQGFQSGLVAVTQDESGPLWFSSDQEETCRLSTPRPSFPQWPSRGGAPRGGGRGVLRGGPSKKSRGRGKQGG